MIFKSQATNYCVTLKNNRQSSLSKERQMCLFDLDFQKNVKKSFF